MAAYSMDLRLRVLRDADAGLPSDELAEKYSVSRAWVDRLKQRRRPRGHGAPAPLDTRHLCRKRSFATARARAPSAHISADYKTLSRQRPSPKVARASGGQHRLGTSRYCLWFRATPTRPWA